jgi:hypothetical protein
MTVTSPSGVTRETVPRAISTSAIEPSASDTGPSGKRNPVATTFISTIPFPFPSNGIYVLKFSEESARLTMGRSAACWTLFVAGIRCAIFAAKAHFTP